ncbi:MAG: hypothetical protein GX444_07100 [Myxococcales bacterium]|nr:hypothetical protein [Myxococcales bacterium]
MKWFSICCIGALLLVLCSPNVHSQGLTRGDAAGVANMDYTGDCPGDDLDYDYYLIKAWADEMEANLFTTNFVYPNINHLWMTDYNLVDWGRDHLKMETYHFVIISGHGGTVTVNNLDQNRIKLGKQNPNGDCYVYPRYQMKIGDNNQHKLKILHLVTCHGMTVDQGRLANTWNNTFAGIHQIHGFHGVSWSMPALLSDFEHLANHGQGNNVAYEWLFEMHHEEFEFDQCPVVYIGADSETQANQIFQNETYRVRDDPIYTEPSLFKRWYFEGCDPSQGGPM